jgi:hypothetical protein
MDEDEVLGVLEPVLVMPMAYLSPGSHLLEVFLIGLVQYCCLPVV